MEQIGYRRRNIGPLTRYGRFKGYNRTNRRYARGRPYLRPYGVPGFRTVPYSRRGQILTVRKMLNQTSFSTGTIAISSGGLTWPPAPSTDGFGATSFCLDDLPDDTSYTDIYDQYRITKVELWILPRVTTVDMDDAGSRQNPWLMYLVEDHDDDTPVSSMATLQARNTCIPIDLRRRKYLKFYPNVTSPVYAGATTSGYSTAAGGKKGPWIDCTKKDVRYYGIKWGIPGPNVAGSSYSVTTLFRYTVEFRGQR